MIKSIVLAFSILIASWVTAQAGEKDTSWRVGDFAMIRIACKTPEPFFNALLAEKKANDETAFGNYLQAFFVNGECGVIPFPINAQLIAWIGGNIEDSTEKFFSIWQIAGMGEQKFYTMLNDRMGIHKKGSWQRDEV